MLAWITGQLHARRRRKKNKRKIKRRRRRRIKEAAAAMQGLLQSAEAPQSELVGEREREWRAREVADKHGLVQVVAWRVCRHARRTNKQTNK